MLRDLHTNVDSRACSHPEQSDEASKFVRLKSSRMWVVCELQLSNHSHVWLLNSLACRWHRRRSIRLMAWNMIPSSLPPPPFVQKSVSRRSSQVFSLSLLKCRQKGLRLVNKTLLVWLDSRCLRGVLWPWWTGTETLQLLPSHAIHYLLRFSQCM